jgi:simple sugar transport system permease protein
MGVPASISDIITGIILLCMLGCEFFINYKMIFRGHEELPAAPETAAPGIAAATGKEVEA